MQTQLADVVRYLLMPDEFPIDMNTKIGETIKPTVGSIIDCIASAAFAVTLGA